MYRLKQFSRWRPANPPCPVCVSIACNASETENRRFSVEEGGVIMPDSTHLAIVTEDYSMPRLLGRGGQKSKLKTIKK